MANTEIHNLKKQIALLEAANRRLRGAGRIETTGGAPSTDDVAAVDGPLFQLRQDHARTPYCQRPLKTKCALKIAPLGCSRWGYLPVNRYRELPPWLIACGVPQIQRPSRALRHLRHHPSDMCCP